MSARENWSWGPVLSDLARGKLSSSPERSTSTTANGSDEGSHPEFENPAAVPSESTLCQQIPGRGVWFRNAKPSSAPESMREIAGRGIWIRTVEPAPMETPPRIIDLRPHVTPAPRTARHRRETESDLYSELSEPWQPAIRGGVSA